MKGKKSRANNNNVRRYYKSVLIQGHLKEAGQKQKRKNERGEHTAESACKKKNTPSTPTFVIL